MKRSVPIRHSLRNAHSVWWLYGALLKRAIRTVKKRYRKNQMGGNGIFPVVPSIWVVQVQRPIMWKNENPYYSHKFILGCSISLVFSLFILQYILWSTGHHVAQWYYGMQCRKNICWPFGCCHKALYELLLYLTASKIFFKL